MLSSLLLAQVKLPPNFPKDFQIPQNFPQNADQALGIIGTIMAYMFIISIVFFIIGLVIIVALWMLFEKAGEPGWASIVPIYNAIILLKVAGKPTWWILLFFCPGVNVIIALFVWYSVAQRFGQGTGFSIGTALVPMIFLPILAFGGAKFEGEIADDNDRPRRRRARDEDDEDEEEEERPRRKPSSEGMEKPRRKLPPPEEEERPRRRRPAEDEDDDEDDQPPPRRRK